MKKILFIIITLLLASNVYAIGLSPARVFLNFESNLKKEITFTIVNTIDSELNAQISLEGELAPYLVFEETLIPLGPNERKKVKGTLTLPEKIKGGENVIVFRVTEAKEATSMINVRAEVLGKIFITAVYEGYYIEPILTIKNSNDKINFELELSNFGTEEITQASASISISDQEGSVVTSIATNNLEQTIKSYGKAILNAEWLPSVKAGSYKAKATILFHDEMIEIEQGFKVGELFVEVITLPENIESGKINEFMIEIENKWSTPIENVYADIIIKKDGKTVATYKTLSDTIGAWEKKQIKGFVDTSNLGIGEYEIEILLHYEGKTTSKEATLTIVEQTIMEEEKEEIIEEEPEPNKLLTFLIVLVILLAIVSVYLFVKKK